jgi:hypothetical protein
VFVGLVLIAGHEGRPHRQMEPGLTNGGLTTAARDDQGDVWEEPAARHATSPYARARMHARDSSEFRVMANYGQCKASLRNGQRCRVVIETEGSDFCPHHLRLADEHGVETVRNGSVPKRRALRVVEEPTVTIIATMDEPTTTSLIDPAGVRPMLAEAAAENAEQLKASLLEAAGSAVRPVWLTVECSNCGERSSVQAPVPDVRARVAAIELLLREGLGRPPQAEEPRVSRIPDSVEAIEKMPWDDMQALFAAIYVEEIASLQDRGGEQLVRQKLSDLSPAQRDILRHELARVP